MKTLLNKLNNVHPFAAFAAVGATFFVVGGFIHYVNSVPDGLMWLGGGMVVISGLLAISE